MNTRHKRRFERQGVYLVDEIDDGSGNSETLYIPAQWLGEKLLITDEEGQRALDDFLTRGYGMTPHGPGDAPAPNELDTFLYGLVTHDPRAPLAILRFLDDPRARPALIEATRSHDLPNIQEYAQAVGLAGGAGARIVLKERLTEALALVEERSTGHSDVPFARELCYIASALLRLDPDALDAAQILVRLFDHASREQRVVAVWHATEVCRPLSTEAMRLIWMALSRFLDEASDPELFLRAAPMLARQRTDFKKILTRCEQILRGNDHSLRGSAIQAIIHMPGPHLADAVEVLVRWVPEAAPLRLAIEAAEWAKAFVPQERLIDIGRRGLAAASPVLRHESLRVVRALPEALRTALLGEALIDEPEPLLRQEILKLLPDRLAAAGIISEAQRGAHAPRRPFLRRGPLLLDPPDLDTGAVIHAAELGEPLCADERARLHAQLASTERAQQEEAIAALGPDRSPETLDALLGALDRGCAAAAAPLLGFLDGPRVRPALVAALRRAPPADLGSLARVVGVAGDHEAIEALRTRLSDAAAAFEAEAGPVAADAALGTLLAVAQGLLRLDPDAGDAAEGLVLALDRAASPSRWLVVDAIVQVLRPDLATSATRSLERALAPLLDGEDIDSFLAAAPLLARDHGDVVLRRCAAALLDAGGASTREAVLALARIPFPFAARALSTIVRWVRRGEGPLGERLWAAGLVIELLDPESTVELLRRGLAAAAPSLRLDAIRTIQRLSPTAEHLALLATAADGEPDPLLRREMRRVAEGAE